MEFIVLHPQLETIFNQLLIRIRRLQSGGTIDSLRCVGVSAEKQIGASFVSLKTLAAQYQADEKLATLLWSTGRREERIVACFLFPFDLNKEKFTQLLQTSDSYEISEYMGSILLSQHPQFPIIMKEWINSDTPHLQIAALTGGARHLLINKNNSLIHPDEFDEFTTRKYTDRYVKFVAIRYQK